MRGMCSAIIVEFDGTDTTGKTTVAVAVAQMLGARGIASVVVPSARSLVPGFMERLQSLPVSEVFAHELAGYFSRLAWANQQPGVVCLIDRGVSTLMASGVARLMVAGLDEAEARAMVRSQYSNWRHELQETMCVDAWPERRYLLRYEHLESEHALACFLDREEQEVSEQYLRYQRCFLQVMRGWAGQSPGVWDGVLDARARVQLNRDYVVSDLQMTLSSVSQAVEFA